MKSSSLRAMPRWPNCATDCGTSISMICWRASPSRRSRSHSPIAMSCLPSGGGRPARRPGLSSTPPLRSICQACGTLPFFSSKTGVPRSVGRSSPTNRTTPAIRVSVSVTIQPRSRSVAGGGPSRRPGWCGCSAAVAGRGRDLGDDVALVDEAAADVGVDLDRLDPRDFAAADDGALHGGDGSSARRGRCLGGSVPGGLVLAATPLGDSRDASPRLRDALGYRDVVAAEDTRRLRSLAAALDVTVRGASSATTTRVEVARLFPVFADVRLAGRCWW